MIFGLSVHDKMRMGVHHDANTHAAVNSLSESAYQVLACFKEHPEIRLTTKKIIEYTELPRRTVTYSLGQLAEYSLIQKYGQGAGVRYQLSF